MKALLRVLGKVRWGMMEFIAAMLLVSTIIFYLGVVKPAESRLSNLRAELADRQASSPAAAYIRTAVQHTPAGQLESFYAFFDRRTTYTEWLARIYDMADRVQVELREGDYRRADVADVPLDIYELNLPVAGDYPRIRAFSAGVLNAVPVASLDYVSFHRQDPAQNQVQAELHFTLYMPPGNGPRP